MKHSSETVGVFVCSSDGRMDVLSRVLPSVLKFWPDCPYPLYVGLNSATCPLPGVKAVRARQSSWREETLEQISQLEESHLLIILDDFLFRRSVNQKSVAWFVQTAIASNMPYLRLLPMRRSIFQRRKPAPAPVANVTEIPEGRPFYSGLQIAIWERKHFSALLGGQGSIWEFEHHKSEGRRHFAILGQPPIVYSHLVEKGRWLAYAPALLKQAGLPTDLGSRSVWPKWTNVRVLLDEVRFHLFGYANH